MPELGIFDFLHNSQTPQLAEGYSLSIIILFKMAARVHMDVDKNKEVRLEIAILSI